MITEIVTVRPPGGFDPDQMVVTFESTVETWASNPDLLRKNYIFDSETGVVGGIYLWKHRDCISRWHGAEFLTRARRVFGADPKIEIFETPIVVDNLHGEIIRG